MSFQWPLALLALLAVPLAIFGYVLLERRRHRQAAAFATPALVPNLVGRSPGRLRHLPPALALLALAALATGLARPHATLSVRQEQATVVLAMDTSRSMVATDVPPSRLAVAQQAVRRFLGKLPEGYRVGMVSFAQSAQTVLPATANREAAQAALRNLRTGDGTALGEGIARAIQVAQRVPAEEGKKPPASILVLSDGAQTQGVLEPQAAAARAKKLKIPVYTVAFGTDQGVVEVVDDNGFTQRVTVPPDPPTLRKVAQVDRRAVLRGARRGRAERRLRGARLADRQRQEGTRGHGRLRRGRCLPAARRRRPLGVPLREAAVKRALLVLIAVAAVAGFGPAAADAGTECDGLIVCIPVKGPWVQVPGGGTPTYYQLSCPGRGQIIGGLDADRAGPLELSFLGMLGGPVGPGVTTNRSAVFVARTTQSLASFRPLLGCIPASGGGGRARTSYQPKRKLMAAAPVVDATIRRVKDIRLKDTPRERAGLSCLSGERLLAYSTVVAFRRNRPLALSALGSVRATARAAGNRVVANVRSGITRPQNVRVELQIHAICVRGPS